MIGPEGFRYVPRRRFAARPMRAATAVIGLTAAGTLLGACTFATAGYHQPAFAALGTTFSLGVPQRGYSGGTLAALGVGGAVLVGLATLALLVGMPGRAHGRPGQPRRVLIGGGRTAHRAAAVTIAVTAWSALLIANDLWLDVTGIVAGTVGSLVGAVALVGWLVARGVERDGGPPLALRDVAHLAGPRRRRPVEPEPPAPIWTRPDPCAPPDPQAPRTSLRAAQIGCARSGTGPTGPVARPRGMRASDRRTSGRESARHSVSLADKHPLPVGVIPAWDVSSSMSC